MENMDKKDLIIVGLVIAILFTGIGNLFFVCIGCDGLPVPDPSNDLVIGTSSGPYTLELVDSWDSHSNNIFHQVVETLFSYDLYDLDLPRVNRLAYSYWWENSTSLQIRLREGILFHDGTPFNAEAVKWNLDRLQYLINATGTNHGEVAHTQSLWQFPDGETFIMDTITTVGEYNITITLNGPYGPFLNTLSYVNAGMISPTAHAADETSFIDLINGDVVGTGPFKYVWFIPNVECRLERWDQYWRKPANFEYVTFVIYSDETTMNNALLSKNIDFLIRIDPSIVPSFENESHITVKHFTEDTGLPGLNYQYMGFNNKKYNATWRKAFSYAINYTYIIEELKGGNVIRAKSPISPAFGNSYNISCQGAYYNLTIAREAMVSMGFGNMSWTDAQWITVAENSSPFLILPFTYHNWDSFSSDLSVALRQWFKLIGLELIDDCIGYNDFLNYLFDDNSCLGVCVQESGRWGPDYLEPLNILNPPPRPYSNSNSARVNDTKLNNMMVLALNTTDDEVRNDIYKNIQWYMSEVGYFHGYLSHPKITYVHAANIYDVPYNAMERFEAYGIWRGLYPM